MRPDFSWLEAVDDPLVDRFVQTQSARTDRYLSTLALREHFQKRVGRLCEGATLDSVGVAGEWVFGLESRPGVVSALVRAPSMEEFRRARSIIHVEPAPERTISHWYPSERADLIACVVSVRGETLHEVVVLEASTGEAIDRIGNVAGTAIVWSTDGLSIRYLSCSSSAQAERTIRSHSIATTQDSDELVFASPSAPNLRYLRLLGGTGRWLIVAFDSGPKTPNSIAAIRADVDAEETSAPIPIASAKDGAHRLVGVVGDEVYLITEHGADRRRVVAMDLRSRSVRPVTPEHATATLLRGVTVGRHLALKYTDNGSQFVTLVDATTGSAHRLHIGTFDSISHLAGGSELVIMRSTITRPPEPLLVSLAQGTPLLARESNRPAHDVTVERITAISPDGTSVPVTLALPRGRSAPGPLMLYAYGGFGVALRPGYSPLFSAWLGAGGAMAIAHVRGGGELGQRWHTAAVREGRQRSFDDLYAVAAELMRRGLTTPSHLVLHGRSNGGLLAAVALTQRPDLWAAVLPAAGIYDMLRFDRFAVGHAWVDEFGDPSDDADAAVLRAYSPLHNVKQGRRYPPTLVSVGTRDERVAPSHAYKFIAALHEAGSAHTAFLHVNRDGSHGFGASTDELAHEYADQLAFAAEHSGLKPTEGQPEDGEEGAEKPRLRLPICVHRGIDAAIELVQLSDDLDCRGAPAPRSG